MKIRYTKLDPRDPEDANAREGFIHALLAEGSEADIRRAEAWCAEYTTGDYTTLRGCRCLPDEPLIYFGWFHFKEFVDTLAFKLSV